MERRFSMGCALLDEILGGGFRLGRVSLIYGEASTGKTTIALRCAANHLRSETQGRVFYVDADGKLSTNRLMQILGNGSDLLERFLVLRPRSFSEQTEVIERLPALLTGRPAQVVVDSLTGLYRLEAGDAAKTFAANKGLNRQLGFLAEAAKTSGSAVLLTGQVHGVPESSQVEMVAERLLRYWSDIILRLEMTQMTGIRQAVLEKPSREDNVCRFSLSESSPTEETGRW